MEFDDLWIFYLQDLKGGTLKFWIFYLPTTKFSNILSASQLLYLLIMVSILRQLEESFHHSLSESHPNITL